ncbi:single-stranded DNA-binding protein [Schleiferilactobacillus harbinensis]|uniref:Single-stranded DNA-binding protein n=1 Tax=Schleiferilactobacillus harbinensis DSM 16991 TaxID=1122147 RepID=A0A0R1XDD0_9LACO|nr:single-stranded DNA-binding protein [Schleiferilactobacillus harbinensis]KRM28066.1 single-strand DNA-binding protein [Schleiferilactobacillus harbinensis DSM 16991]QFR63572.1 single-stranded DNA-binding protein [Schleiferilactobacillus harbinensis]
MINRVVLVGRLTRDVDLRYTQGGTAVGRFTVAVTRNFKNSQGERDSDFINCTMWRKAAENFAQFTRKGSLVGIDGRIQTHSYENQQGQRVFVTEVVADDFALLEPKSVTDARPRDTGSDNQGGNPNQGQPYGGNNQSSYNGGQGNNQSQPPLNQNNGNSAAPNANSGAPKKDDSLSDPFADNGQPIDISDDDLPF